MYGSANCTPRFPWNPALRCTNVTPDCALAAFAVSTTSATALSTTSCFADVVARRAEAAVERRAVVPERADHVHVDPEVRALQDADAVHRECRATSAACTTRARTGSGSGSAAGSARRARGSRRPATPRARRATRARTARRRARSPRCASFIHDPPGITTSSPEPRPARVREMPRAPSRDTSSGMRMPAAEQVDLEFAGVQGHDGYSDNSLARQTPHRQARSATTCLSRREPQEI